MVSDFKQLPRNLSDIFIFIECYQKGKAIASDRSKLPLKIFPASPIGNIEQILDENWFP